MLKLFYLKFDFLYFKLFFLIKIKLFFNKIIFQYLYYFLNLNYAFLY